MAEIVGSLFGVSPEQLMRQRQTTDANNAFRFAQLSPMERAQMSIYQGSAGLGRAVGGLLGGDAELEKVSQIKQLSSQFDLTTPEGARQFAQALQPFAPNEAMMAVREADRMETASLGRQKTQAEITKAELSATQEENLRKELSELGPNATEQQILTVVTKYGSPDRILRELTASRDRQAAMADRRAKAAAGGADGAGVAGPVGKSGAYRDADGIVYSATEMAKQRAGFQGLEKLADNLNSISEDDIKNAESFFDYTQGETLKTIGGKVSPKTISAQAKINASQLLKQIESLPPGSASNADMIAAKSSFPGYGDAGNLSRWVTDTKKLLADSMQRQSEQYGFKQKVQVKGLDGATPPPTSNQNQAALDWLKANPNDPRAPAVRKKLGIQ
jgi:hypothetical protein